MVASDNLTRISTVELKEVMHRRIGQERASQYSHHLIKYLNAMLSKAEFDKICIQTIGRENLSLHNRLIRAILQNAVHATTPPLKVPRSPICKSLSMMTCEEGGAQVHWKCMHEKAKRRFQECKNCKLSSIAAPLGVSIDLGGPRYSSSLHHSYTETCVSSGDLPDTKSLGRRVLKKLALKGVGISVDGANMLNRGLDVYTKNEISQCIMQPTCPNMVDRFCAAMEAYPSILR